MIVLLSSQVEKMPLLDILVNANYNNICLWVLTKVGVEASKLEIITFSLLLNHLSYFAYGVSFCTSRRNLTALFLISTECPELKKPDNGNTSCRKVSGKLLCIMSCDEGYSFNSEAVTMYGCGPDTKWKWNNMEKLQQPRCLSE